MISADRLDELETLRPPDDLPDDARVTLPARDVRDLVALGPIVRAGCRLRDMLDDQRNFADGKFEAACAIFDRSMGKP